MAATKNAPKKQQQEQQANGARQLPTIAEARLAYHPMIEERFGVDKASWRALVDAIFPLASSTESIILALSYCKARRLDPFKRNVHIVPIWSKEQQRMVDTVWPGIGELRTTAFRTGQYAGRSKTDFGPDISQKVGKSQVTFPEWAQVTVRRTLGDKVCEFEGPKVYWLETYSQFKRDDASPNSMWMKRPRGQLEKCAEAAALRAAFPEEIGNEYTNDEVGVVADNGEIIDHKPAPTPPTHRINLRDDPPQANQNGDKAEATTAVDAEPASDDMAAKWEKWSRDWQDAEDGGHVETLTRLFELGGEYGFAEHPEYKEAFADKSKILEGMQPMGQS